MIVIYGTTNCTYCQKAKDLAQQRGLQFEFRNMEIDNHHYDKLKELKPDFKKVPQIWWNDRYIGGYTDLAEEIENTLGGFGDGKI
jgi:thioredoxin reductase (NADPH)